VGRALLTVAVLRGATYAGSALAVAGTLHLAINQRLLRRPPTDVADVTEPVSVLLPLRNEALRLEPCLRSLLGQEALADLEILVLDDESTDGTGELVRSLVGDDPRVRLLAGSPPPPGWLGKAHACASLAAAARGRVLVFVDADVVLAPSAIASTVAMLRESGLQLVSPYPRQLADGLVPRLVQPLLQWSWLTLLPLRLAETSPRPSLAAANGQLLAVDAVAYRAVGGHAVVRDAVIEDVELLKALKRQGFRGVVVDGSDLAMCRMYISARDLREGYAKSLWAAFGSPAGAAAVSLTLTGAYVLPPTAALLARDRRTRLVGAVGTLAGVGGRVLAARRARSRVWPDALAHPVSVLAFVGLTVDSFRRHRNGSLTWKGRAL
jgi:glycosyltransferase involved in cell wall biosynthesis